MKRHRGPLALESAYSEGKPYRIEQHRHRVVVGQNRFLGALGSHLFYLTLVGTAMRLDAGLGVIVHSGRMSELEAHVLQRNCA